MKKTFYSNGKLLITGEYTVLDGANAFALPTKYGQYLHIKPGKDKTITWKSFDSDKSIWFKDSVSFSEIDNGITQNTDPVTKTLVKILNVAHNLNPYVLNKSNGFDVITELTFPRKWGLGTSSTLINNIAQWFGINAYTLLNESFGGSGYDIACAQNNTPIIYRLENNKPIVEKTDFNPPFANTLFFVYLNQKQNSRSAIEAYKSKKNDIAAVISKINSITQRTLKTQDISEFINLMDEHAEIMSKVLELPTVKEEFFADFNGTVKSLGAWGGDFILAVSLTDEADTTHYFKEKGYPVIIPYKDMIL
ncbi:GYDIA family GHMP kinase [Flavobacterium alkalisoli]|uniref:GYDIA family GHMP kinase n=1 Tax=Flavobacterium alkalisoli TaxID=2602769 RepID=UPI003A8E2AE8